MAAAAVGHSRSGFGRPPAGWAIPNAADPRVVRRLGQRRGSCHHALPDNTHRNRTIPAICDLRSDQGHFMLVEHGKPEPEVIRAGAQQSGKWRQWRPAPASGPGPGCVSPAARLPPSQSCTRNNVPSATRPADENAQSGPWTRSERQRKGSSCCALTAHCSEIVGLCSTTVAMPAAAAAAAASAPDRGRHFQAAGTPSLSC